MLFTTIVKKIYYFNSFVQIIAPAQKRLILHKNSKITGEEIV